METRKVQRLGPSTLAMTLPAEWAKEHGVNKGDEVSLRMGGKGTLTVLPESVSTEESEAVINADGLDARSLERAIVAQYVLGRRVIHVRSEGTLDSEHINAVYKAETQLMGLGVIEETPEDISIRCSVDPEDFTLDNLLERLENTGSTMRGEAVKALAHGNPDLAQRALNR
ncbi:AbrB/MazE/SpoVT family DNA-binding domain-containing protein, partial [Halorubrum sp. DTA46]